MSDEIRKRSHRCSHCDLNWPLTGTYANHCVVCGGETWTCSERPFSLDEARQLCNDLKKTRELRALFEDYYRCHLNPRCDCGQAVTIVDDFYAICPDCDTPDPLLTLDTMGGWDTTLLGDPEA